MRKQLFIMIIVSFMLLIPAFTVSAEQSSNESTDSRLSQAVTDQQLTLDDAAKTIITTKCVAAKHQITDIKTKTDRLVKLRIDTYSDMQKELQAIKLRMARQGIDASEIDLLIGKVQQHLDSFTLKASDYGMALDDITTVDCVQKPEQFEAGLVLARIQQRQLLGEANGLKSTMKTADSSTFNQLKKRLTVQ